MRTNNLLTYLLYALLLGLIAAAGFKACQMKKEKQLLAAKQETELQQTLRDMGYKTEDSTAAAGSTYAGGDPAVKTNTPATETSKDGIEDEPDASKPVSSSSKTTAATTPKTDAVTTPKTTAKTVEKPVVTAPSTAVRDLDTNPRSGRYRVQAGSFTKMEGARRQLETVIKMGYRDAEIGKTNRGKYAVVVVMRTDNKGEAIQIADKLEAAGLDAAVIDNRRKN